MTPMKTQCLTDNESSGHSVAAIVCKSGHLANQVLDQLVADMKETGRKPAGYLQRPESDPTSGCDLRLENIRYGSRHRVTQNLGSGSVSCNVDTDAMERLGMNLIQELNAPTDLLILNRFGKRESEGAGFCHVLEYAIEKDIPVLTVVSENFLDRWKEYGGDLVTTLPCSAAAVNAWCSQIFENRLIRESDDSRRATQFTDRSRLSIV